MDRQQLRENNWDTHTISLNWKNCKDTNGFPVNRWAQLWAQLRVKLAKIFQHQRKEKTMTLKGLLTHFKLYHIKNFVFDSFIEERISFFHSFVLIIIHWNEWATTTCTIEDSLIFVPELTIRSELDGPIIITFSFKPSVAHSNPSFNQQLFFMILW